MLWLVQLLPVLEALKGNIAGILALFSLGVCPCSTWLTDRGCPRGCGVGAHPERGTDASGGCARSRGSSGCCPSGIVQFFPRRESRAEQK